MRDCANHHVWKRVYKRTCIHTLHYTRSACMNALIASKAQVDACDDYGWTSLHRACGVGNANVVKCLIAAKAKRGVTDCNGMKPIEWAKAFGMFVCLYIDTHVTATTCVA